MIQYWKKLVGMLKEMDLNCKNEKEKNEIWAREYNKFFNRIRLSVSDERTELIILGHVLIHPQFCYDLNGENFRDELDNSRSMVVLPDEKNHPCEISKIISDYECIFNEHRKFRNGNVVGDHLWPYSLGGPTNSRADLTSNRLLLCNSCNTSKSNSIFHYNWEEHGWLFDRLGTIKRKKSNG
jgi:hypothetical protein